MHTLIVLIGPTGVGKTELSLRLAEQFDTCIVSADSRQLYADLKIGTAAPTTEQLQRVEHHFVGMLKLTDYYSAAQYEAETLNLLETLFTKHDIVVLTGGSMMYVDALCHGIDEMPDVRDEVRQAVWRRYEEEGLEGILGELKILDPDYYHSVDPKNYKRVLHGYEVSLSTGRPFSSFHSGRKKERPFRIIKLGLTREREELYERIDRRVYMMLQAGLVEEARRVYPLRQLNALNTVGYKELFAHFSGEIDLEEAVRLIQRNSRHYARKQLSWWRRDEEIRWFDAEDWDGIIRYLDTALEQGEKTPPSLH